MSSQNFFNKPPKVTIEKTRSFCTSFDIKAALDLAEKPACLPEKNSFLILGLKIQ
jgi:hypothetical protein